MLECFFCQDGRYVLYLKVDQDHLPILCAASREIPKLLQDMLWNREHSAILTSGTLKAGKGFEKNKTGYRVIWLRESTGICGRLSFFLRKKLYAVSAKNIEEM